MGLSFCEDEHEPICYDDCSLCPVCKVKAELREAEMKLKRRNDKEADRERIIE